MSARLSVLLVVIGLAVPSSVAQADNPRLVGTVGANASSVITLRDASGNVVSHLDPGTYDIAVGDRSEFHNFHLQGPGVDVATAVALEEDVTWTVTFTDGTYTYTCDEHPTTMRGRFTVGAVRAPAKLSAAVGPRRTISLRPQSVAAGRASIAVSDKTKADNFHLVGPGVNRKTGVAFRGRVTWNVTLEAGRYTYRSDAHRSLRGALTVTSGSS
jgi:plastocyanin